jgi:hypothetical protein
MSVDTEIPRTRDCYTLVKGETFTPTVDANLAANGWLGGVGVAWASSSKDEFLVTLSDGYVAGFLVWGSNESSDQYTAMTRNQPYYRFATMGSGSWLIVTQQFEQYTYASRKVGPLVAITYSPSDRLRFSLRGFWTKEDEWTLSSDPRAPNLLFTGFVVQVPSASTGGYMTIQTSI